MSQRRIGDLICFRVKTYQLKSFWDTPYGVMYLYLFVDFNDNVFVWKTKTLIDVHFSKMKGYIKSIDSYKNEQQIVLKYCRFQ